MTRSSVSAAPIAAAADTDATVRIGPRDASMPRVTYISWAESCSRSDHTARELGGSSHMVYLAQFGSRQATIALKYLGQWLQTSRILHRERPDVVFTMTPPVFAALPAFWYAWRHRKQVVLDAHSAAFVLPRWRYFQWLQRALCRRAATTLVSNEHLAATVRAAGAHATVVPDVPIIFSRKDPFARPSGFVVAVVCSFDVDEPLAAILAAAEQLPHVQFYMTGNPRHFPADLAPRIPANVTLTGFLSTAAYGGLLTAADAVLALTTLDHTMLRGAYEAIYQDTPVIVSDWPILRESFPHGAIHVDNSPAAIVAAVRHMETDPETFRSGARRLRQTKLARWDATRQAILARVRASLQ
jgi:glycosyltransferase involved in cell wall biosynthesis